MTPMARLDFETYSEAGYRFDADGGRHPLHGTKGGIGNVGAAVYTEHPSTEVLSLSYDLLDGLGSRFWVPGMPEPEELFEHIRRGGLLEAWNSSMEYFTWKNVCHKRMGWPMAPLCQFRDAQAKAVAYSLPRALGKAAIAYGLGHDEQKDADGKGLLNKFSMPQSKMVWFHPRKQVWTTAKKSGANTFLRNVEHFRRWASKDKVDLWLRHLAQDSKLCDETIAQYRDSMSLSSKMSQQRVSDALFAVRTVRRFGSLAEALKDRRRIRLRDDPDDAQKLVDYNIQDIVSQGALSDRLPDLPSSELQLWLVDQHINLERGVGVDTQAVRGCTAIVQQATEQYTAEIPGLTDNQIQSIGQLDKIRGFVESYGIYTSDMTADTVRGLLARDDLPANVRRLLEIRESLGAASVKKLYSLAARTCEDGRIRDLLAYWGAHTGRWAGRGPQPQNFPSGGPKVQRCACGRHYGRTLETCPWCERSHNEAHVVGWNPDAMNDALMIVSTGDIRYVQQFFGVHQEIAVVSGCLRGLFVAAPGYELCCSDYSAIEAVVLAMLSGEQWRIDVFSTHGKIYEASAAAITGIPLEVFLQHKKETGEHHPLRKTIGKVAELASGYGGGVGAWKRFGADSYFDSDDEIQMNVRKWRKASPMVVKFWYELERIAKSATLHEGIPFRYRDIVFIRHGRELQCVLPSGRMIRYLDPHLRPSTKEWTDEPELNFFTSDDRGMWVRESTYGGKLTENVVQAVSRDILAHAIVALEYSGFPVVLHVHDEIICEVPKGTRTIEEMETIMATMPPWAAGWPLRAAGGWTGSRYRKD